METLEYKGWIINLKQPEDPDNPRKNYEPLGKIVYNHRNYNVGDEQIKCYGISFMDDFRIHLLENGLTFDDVIYLPVYMYDHSGITIQTKPFSCTWDSGQVGFIYVSKDKLRKEYIIGNVTKAQRLKAIDHLNAEIKEFDAYLRQDTWMACIKESEDEDDEWMGDYYDKDDCINDAKSEIDAIIEHRKKQAQINKEVVTNHLLLKSIKLGS